MDRTETRQRATPAETGIGALVSLLRFHQIPADAEQVAHMFSLSLPAASDMVRYLRGAGLRARAITRDSQSLANAPPAASNRAE